MTIRRAHAVADADADAAANILAEAAAWLIAGGRKLWDPDEIALANIELRAAAGELVLVFEGAEPVACMFLQAEDRMHWPDAMPGDAFYVHRLAVRRNHAGTGWSQRLLDWAAEEARRNGRNFVRLDSEDRPRLLRLYEDAGFRRVDAEPFDTGRHLVIRFERRV
ncbi:MAG TPA: GNAT family N-acetyltransferase [Rhizomicrobium sp.]